LGDGRIQTNDKGESKMKVQDEVKKELKLNEDSLTDLPVAEDQAADTKGGDGHEKWIELNSLQFGTGRGIGSL
jgi:hypothetical protein